MVSLRKNELERADALHEKSLVIDAHSDYSVNVARWRLEGETHVYRRKHLSNLRKGGVNLEVLSVGGDKQTGPIWGPSSKQVLRMLDFMHSEAEESPEALRIVRNVAEIERAKREGVIGVFFDIEGSKVLEEDLYLLRTCYRLGVRTLTLTHNGGNLVASGCSETSPGGLTNFGKNVISELDRLGVIIDVSHASKPSFYDALEVSKKPVINSHSNSRALCDHVRNIDDDQIHALAEKGGVIGIVFYGEFVDKKNPTLEKVMRHVDHITDLVGIDHLGVGADYIDYFKDYLMSASVPSRIPKENPSNRLPFVTELGNVSMLRNFTHALVSSGYSDREIEKILGKNFLRVYTSILG